MTFFLGMTRLEDFWPEGRPLHLLGSWCVPESGLPAGVTVLPYPWDDEAAFRQAADRVTEASERLLPRLADALNRVHSLDRSVRYWRFVVGPWLSWDLQILYDHYHSLRLLLDEHPDLETVGIAPGSYITPQSLVQMCLGGYWTEHYKLTLYSQVLAALEVPFGTKELPTAELSPAWRFSPPGRLKRVVLGAQEFLARRAKIALVGTGLSPTASLKLFFGSGFRIVPCSQFAPPRVEPPRVRDERLRARLTFDDGGLAEFERVALHAFRTTLPLSYVEGFAAARAEVASRKSQPRVWLSGMSWYFDETFGITAAESQENGAKVLATQHGGYYGMLESNPIERDEQELGETFYTWGWSETLRNKRNTKVLPALKLAGSESVARRRARRRSSFGDAVLVTTSHPRHLLRFQSHPCGPQWERYIDSEIRFVQGLTEEGRRRLVVRLHGADYGWGRDRRWRSAIPDVRFDDRKRLRSHLLDARLMVVDHPATTFLETLAANVPTLLFWSPSAFRFRPGASHAIDELRRVGILCDGPETAALRYTEIFEDVEGWWRESERQRVRATFCSRFALTSPDWLRGWSAELFKVAEAPTSSRVLSTAPLGS